MSIRIENGFLRSEQDPNRAHHCHHNYSPFFRRHEDHCFSDELLQELLEKMKRFENELPSQFVSLHLNEGSTTITLEDVALSFNDIYAIISESYPHVIIEYITNENGIFILTPNVITTNSITFSSCEVSEEYYKIVSATIDEENNVNVSVANKRNKPCLSEIMNGKVGLFIGDNIIDNESGASIPDIMSDLLGCTIYNGGTRGFSASGDTQSLNVAAGAIASGDYRQLCGELDEVGNYQAKSMYQAGISQLNMNDVDFILMSYGTNDWLEQRSLDNTDDAEDVNTVAGGIRLALRKLMEAYPHLAIYFFTPSYIKFEEPSEPGNIEGGDTDDGIGEGADGEDTTDTPSVDPEAPEDGEDEGIDAQSEDDEVAEKYTLRKLCSVIKSACDDMNVNCLDNYVCGINEHNIMHYSVDGVTLNDNGRRLLAEKYAKYVMCN